VIDGLIFTGIDCWVLLSLKCVTY